ncbi:MAG: Gfo/Idh/MocA family oxidoreductase [Anaerolineaceae bacterium]|jgi:predicted dehydrogenase|nr:Gfo/Idh/MocA family oxidoreductase [Anaerolineaceae bacterium]
MKFLIAGFGSIGRRHLRNLLALGQEDIILYRSHRSTLDDDEIARFPVETDLQKALAHQPDGVIISNPTALHLDVAIPAAQAGCHILMEKPISHTMDDISALEKALKEGGSKMLVGFQFRFHPGLQQAKKLLDEGSIGDLISVRSHWGEYLPDWHPWEDYRQSYAGRKDLGGGVVRTLCHPLDYLRWLVGEVESLWALTGNLGGLGINVEDVSEIGLQFDRGVLGSVHLDFCQRPPRHTLEMIGNQGTITWDNADGGVRLYRAEKAAWEDFPAPEGFDRNDLFLAEMRNFINVIAGKEEPVCSFEDGVRAMEIVLAVCQSSRYHQWVELD